MPLTVINHAPEARCYQCGSTDIHSVCHHCARPMCARHESAAARERPPVPPAAAAGGPGAPAGPADPGAEAGDQEIRPTSREYAGLKLLPAQAAVYHCEEHQHTVRWTDDAVMLFRGPTPPHELPPLPVFPDVNSVSIVERLTGEVRLTDEGYLSRPQPVEGSIVIGMSHSQPRWQETMGRYQKRHKLPAGYPVTFAAGFAKLRGKAGLVFAGGQDVVLPDGLGLVFAGGVAGHDLFDAKPGRPQGECEVTARYRLMREQAPQDIPLWIVPSLGATSDRRVLMIDLHWNMPEADGSRAELDQFELIEFEVPHQWGNLVAATPSGAATSAPAPGQPRVVRWRQYRPAAGEPRRRPGSAAPARSLTLRMEFEKPILDQPYLSGSLRASFNRTLSGVTGLDFYLPGGGPVQYLNVKPRTEISVGFQVSLNGLRYQERRTVPDGSKSSGEDAHRLEPDRFPGVMPDYRTVIELTNAISDDGYYVKTVVEDHPNHDHRDRTFKRGWDITGRWYEGVFPINFIISLRGTEPEDTVAGAALSRTVAQVGVDGTFPNADMKRQIEDKWEGLHDRVTALLTARVIPLGNPDAGVIHGVVAPRPGIAAAVDPSPADPPLAVPVPVIDAPPPPAPPPPPPPPAAFPPGAYPGGNAAPGQVPGGQAGPAPGGQAGLVAELKRQRGVLIADPDLIGERTCEEALADIESELLFLEQPEALFSGPPEEGDEVNGLLQQRRGLRGGLIAGKRSEDFYRRRVADINAELKNLGWSQ